MLGKLTTPANRHEMLSIIGIDGKDCIEIGVADGGFSAAILANNPKTLVLLDPWMEQSKSIYAGDHNNLGSFDFQSRFEQVCGRFAEDNRVTIVRDFSFNQAQLVPDLSFDFVYIDAVHSMESVLMDMTAWWPKVRNGGWLCGHDYTGKYTGVKMAVDGFCKITGNNLGLLTMEPWASWGIVKPSGTSKS